MATSGFNPNYFNNAMRMGAFTGTPAASTPAVQQAMDPAAYRALVDEVYGEKPKANYGNSLMQFGLNLMQQPGDFLSGVGKAGMHAMPTFMGEQARIRGDEDKRKNMVMQLAIQDLASTRKLTTSQQLAKAKEEAALRKEKRKAQSAEELEAIKQKNREALSKLNASEQKDLAKLTASLKTGAKGPKVVGGKVIDAGRYNEIMESSGDMSAAFEGSVIRDVPTGYKERAQEIVGLENELKQLDPNSPDYEYKAAVLEEMRAAADKNDNLIIKSDGKGGTTIIKGREGKQAVIGGEGQVWELNPDTYDTLKESSSAVEKITKRGDHLLAVVNRNKSWATDRTADVGTTLAGFDTFVKEVTSNPEYREDIGSVGNAIKMLERNANSDEPMLSPDMVESFKTAGKERQEALSVAVMMAYSIAKSWDPRVTDKDLAFAMKTLGYDGEAWFQDKGRVMRGIQTAVTDTIQDHQTLLSQERAPEWYPETDAGLKAATKYGWSEAPVDGGHGTQWQWAPPAGLDVDLVAPVDGVYTVDSQAEYDKLEPGSIYIDKADGKKYRKQ